MQEMEVLKNHEESSVIEKNMSRKQKSDFGSQC